MSTVPNPGLTVTDELAGEILFPTLDESLFNADPMDIDLGPRDGDPLNWTSQLPSDPLNVEVGRSAPEEQPGLYDDDLGLDLDIEMGRDAPPARSVADDIIDDGPKLYDEDLGLTFGDDDGAQFNNDDTELPIPEEPMAIDDETHADVSEFRPQQSQSPLSSTRSSEVRDIDQTELTEVGQTIGRQPAAKKRKVLPMDREIIIPNAVVKKQQADRSAILKPLTLLPRDPILLALMTTMQQGGGFVSSLMNGDRGLAPQLRGLLSIEAISKSNALKRKRDSGVADLGNEFPENMPQLEIPEDEADHLPQDEGVADLSHEELSPVTRLPVDDEPQFLPADDADVPSPLQDNFDETTAPLLYPEEQGPISVGTQHAVHILRDHFGGSAEAASSRKGALFQDLYPEARTTKAEATKMFFETLVLATKDAIKVEQSPTELGGAIRIRPKRNLWREWAEKEAGGEIAQGEIATTA